MIEEDVLGQCHTLETIQILAFVLNLVGLEEKEPLILSFTALKW
jgi:hypothetical protein